jgi:hypothetical protein
MTCKNCLEDKIKEPVIRNEVTRFVDKNSKLWNGKMCPDCYRDYNRKRMRLKRSQSHEHEILKLQKIE